MSSSAGSFQSAWGSVDEPNGMRWISKGGRLYAAPFDPVRALVTGQARAVLEDVYTSQTGGYALFDVSSDGTGVSSETPNLSGS